MSEDQACVVEVRAMVLSAACVYETIARASVYLSYGIQRLVIGLSIGKEDATHFALVASDCLAVSLGAGLGAADERPVALLGSYLGRSILNLSIEAFRFDLRQVHSHSAETTGI